MSLKRARVGRSIPAPSRLFCVGWKDSILSGYAPATHPISDCIERNPRSNHVHSRNLFDAASNALCTHPLHSRHPPTQPSHPHTRHPSQSAQRAGPGLAPAAAAPPNPVTLETKCARAPPACVRTTLCWRQCTQMFPHAQGVFLMAVVLPFCPFVEDGSVDSILQCQQKYARRIVVAIHSQHEAAQTFGDIASW